MSRLKGGHWEQFEGHTGLGEDDVAMDDDENGRDRGAGEDDEDWEQEVADTLASLASIHVEEG